MATARFIPKEILAYNSTAKDKVYKGIIGGFSLEKGYCSLSDEDFLNYVSPNENKKSVAREIKRLKDRNLILVDFKKGKRRISLNQEIFPSLDFKIGTFISEKFMNSNLSYNDKLILALEYSSTKYSQEIKAGFISLTLDGYRTALKRAKRKFSNSQKTGDPSIFSNNINKSESQNEPHLNHKMNHIGSQNEPHIYIDNIIDNNIIKIKYINIFNIIFDGLKSIKKCLDNVNENILIQGFEFGDLLESLNLNIVELEKLILCTIEEPNADTNNSRNLKLEEVNMFDSKQPNADTKTKPVHQSNSLDKKKGNIALVNNRGVAPPAQNNVQGKDNKPEKKRCRELEEIVFGFGCFTKHNIKSDSYDDSVGVIKALKNGTLRTIIASQKAYDNQIACCPNRFQNNNPITKGQLDDILDKKYDKEERIEIYQKLANLFDAENEPKSKNSLLKRKSLYSLCNNKGNIRFSWLVEVLVFGNKPVNWNNNKNFIEPAKNKDEKRFIKMLDRKLVPDLIYDIDLQKDYLSAIRRTKEKWGEILRGQLYDRVANRVYVDDFGAFMEGLIDYIFVTTSNKQFFNAGWLTYNSKSCKNFVHSIMKLKDDCYYEIETEDEDGVELSPDEQVRIAHKNLFGKNPKW
jgi:hypothetical protein